MARYMVSKGFDVSGYDIDVDAMRRAIEQGATTCLSAAQVGDHAEVVIVMVGERSTGGRGRRTIRPS